MGEKDAWFDRVRARLRLEHGLLRWRYGARGLRHRAGHRDPVDQPRLRHDRPEDNLAILAFELLIVGLQIFFSSFLLSILGLRRGDGR